MSESEIKYQAMENHYKSIIKLLQEEIKELKLKLANVTNQTNEYESSFEGYLKMQGYEQIHK